MKENAANLLQMYFYSIKISEQKLKFGDIVVNKREFHASKQAIALNLVHTNNNFRQNQTQ